MNLGNDKTQWFVQNEPVKATLMFRRIVPNIKQLKRAISYLEFVFDPKNSRICSRTVNNSAQRPALDPITLTALISRTWSSTWLLELAHSTVTISLLRRSRMVSKFARLL